MLKKEKVIENVLKQIEKEKLINLENGLRENIPKVVSLAYEECEKSLERERRIGENYHEYFKANPIINREW